MRHLAPLGDKLEGSYQRLKHLYGISKLLAQFERIETTVPALLMILAESIPLCSAILIEKKNKHPNLFVWHCPPLNPEHIQTARQRALSEYAYLTDQKPSQVDPKIIEATMLNLSCPSSQAMQKGQYVVLPLALHGAPIFGVFQIDGVSAFDKMSLAFINAVTNQLAVALDRHNARVNEMALNAALERRISQRTEQLERKINELNAFSYSIAHDLRAPLRAMSGFGQALLKDYAHLLDKTGQEYLRRIVSGSQRMDALTRDLLAFSQITLSDITIEPVSLSCILLQVLGAMESELQQRKAHVHFQRDLPKVLGHALTLTQVLANLISNAAKFVAAGVEPRISVKYEPRDGWTRLWIEDNGIGIPPEQHERIFQIFQRLHTRDSYPGTGIGLAIASKGMQRMGGRIGVESAPGKGSRFWIELELAGEGNEPA